MRGLALILLFAALFCGTASTQKREDSTSSNPGFDVLDCQCSCSRGLSPRYGVLAQLELLLLPTLEIDVDAIMEAKHLWLDERAVALYVPMPSTPVAVHPTPVLTSVLTPAMHVRQLGPQYLFPFHLSPPWWRVSPAVSMIAAPPSGIPSPAVLTALSNLEYRFDLSGLPTKYCVAPPFDAVDWSISKSYNTCAKVEAKFVDMISFEHPVCLPSERGIVVTFVVFVATLVVSITLFLAAIYASVLADPKDYVSGPAFTRLCMTLSAVLSFATLLSVVCRSWRFAWMFAVDDLVVILFSIISYVRRLKNELLVLQKREDIRKEKKRSRCKAASLISATFKGYQQRKQFKVLVHAVRLVQDRFRLLRQQRRTAAATTIQTAARRWLHVKREDENARRVQQVIKAQALARGALVRRQLNREVKAAVVIQASFRAHLARRAIHTTTTLAKLNGVSPEILLSLPSFAESAPMKEFKDSNQAFGKLMSSRRLSLQAKKKNELIAALGVGEALNSNHVSLTSLHSASRLSMTHRRPVPLPMPHTKKHSVRG